MIVSRAIDNTRANNYRYANDNDKKTNDNDKVL